VLDDGRGPRARAAGWPARVRERAALYGGVLAARERPGGGALSAPAAARRLVIRV
jgi:hypothetical protein